MVQMSEFEDQPLGFLVRRLMARLRPEAATALRPLGLGLPEFVCLRILETYPGRTGAELARNTHVTAQAMNLVLHELEDMGAVTRRKRRRQAARCPLSSPARAGRCSSGRKRPS